ncbi:MAG: phosphatidate cytidylyltransferase, partial [Pseudomonadota bacterium]
LMIWELGEMTLGAGAGLSPGGIVAAGTGALAVLLTEGLELRFGLLIVLLVAVTQVALSGQRGRIAALGLVYITLGMMCIDGLRSDFAYGFAAVVWLVLVVIAADVGGYFFGRMLGGPKLWPRVSPKKTWSGFLGGLGLAVLVGSIFSVLTPGTFAVKVAVMSAVIAAVSVAGDLLESGIKRHYGVKDASTLMPGHGGLLDRFDGLVAAAIIAGAISFARGQSIFIW